MFLILSLTETAKDGVYASGDVLFTSQTNNVDVRFTSDYSVTRSGFGLNIRSIPCTERDNFPETVIGTESAEEYSDCDDSVHEVPIAAGEVLEGAIVTNTESDGNYSNNACQQWNIIAGENEVHMLFFFVLFQYRQPLDVAVCNLHILIIAVEISSLESVFSVLSSQLVMEVSAQRKLTIVSLLKIPTVQTVCFLYYVLYC